MKRSRARECRIACSVGGAWTGGATWRVHERAPCDPKLADYSRAKFPACPKRKCFRPERKLTRDFTLTFDRSSSSEKSRVSEFICRGPGCMLVPCKLEFWQTDKHAHTVACNTVSLHGFSYRRISLLSTWAFYISTPIKFKLFAISRTRCLFLY